jgi:PD-(D/E)XK nuclease superfamily protein
VPNQPVEVRVLRDLIRHMANEDDPLTPLLDDYYLKRDRAPQRLQDFTIDLQPRPRPPGRLSPSKLCGCERQAAFAFLGMPGKQIIDPAQQAIFDDGNWRHYKWDATFLDMQLVLGPRKFKVISIEEPVELPEFYIAGSLDAVIVIKGKLYVVDFKGINQWGFERVFRDHKPHEAHVLQLITYMKARKVRRGLLLYDDKNTQKQAIFAITFTKKAWSEVEDWADNVLRRITEQKLPPMSLDCQAGTFLFERCPFASHCYGGANPEKVRQRMYRNFDSLEGMWERGKLLATA